MKKQKMLYVYIVKCSDDSYYIGVTNSWKKRLEEHNEGKDEESYTYSRRPVELMYRESFSDFELAIKRETQLKTWSRAKKEALIISDRKRLKELAECKNESTHKNNFKVR
jgi:putative endonuclease